MTNASGTRFFPSIPSAWSLFAALIAGIVLLPIVAVLLLAMSGFGADWGHLWGTSMPRYALNSVIMMVGVGSLAAIIGTAMAWTVVYRRFPMHRFFAGALLAPMAIPAYVAAFALVDVLEYAGPVQTALRDVFGWASAKDYWFPEIRSRWAAILVMSLALYPYVYLFARDAFEEQGARPIDVARSLGKGSVAVFWLTCLPLARPAIAAGAAVVMMEVLGDFGTMDYFAVQTLTTGIFTQWLEAYNAVAAAQIAAMMMLAVLVLGVAERISRRNRRFDSGVRGHMPVRPLRLSGLRGWVTTLLVSLPFLLGFVLPLSVLFNLAGPQTWIEEGLWRDASHTVFLGFFTAALAVLGAFLLYQSIRYARNSQIRLFLPITTIGYATPGAVLALGIMVPLVPIDHWVADRIQAMTGTDPGLLLTGTGAALVLAYFVRFFAIAQGAVESGMSRVTPTMDMVARTLGQTRAGVMRRVHLPLISGSMVTAFVLIFVDTVKELPATLMLRPFDFDTLATRVYTHASREDLEGAAPAALLVTAAGLIPVILLSLRRWHSTHRAG